MKRSFRSISVLVLLVAVFGAGVYFSNSATAQEATAASSSDSALLQKIDALVSALSDLTGNSDPVVNNTNGPEAFSALAVASGHQTPSCLDNYDSWPKSHVEDLSADWNINFMVETNAAKQANTQQGMVDVNGDGLADWTHFFSWPATTPNVPNGACNNEYTLDANGNDVTGSPYYRKEACVYLNNGSGWDKAFRCMIGTELVSTTQTTTPAASYCQNDFKENRYHKVVYYGDCADL